ncbi:hypothetical protein ACFQUX_02610 [Pantoea stewartii]
MIFGRSLLITPYNPRWNQFYGRRIAQKGISPETRVPWMNYHVHENMVTVSGQRLISIVRFKGVSYATKEKPELNKLLKMKTDSFSHLVKKKGRIS